MFLAPVSNSQTFSFSKGVVISQKIEYTCVNKLKRNKKAPQKTTCKKVLKKSLTIKKEKCYDSGNLKQANKTAQKIS